MEQTIINGLIGFLGIMFGFLLHVIWGAVKDLRKEGSKHTQDIASLQLLVAGQYVKREELAHFVDAVFAKLEAILTKLDKKVDRDQCLGNQGRGVGC